jgi:hypothetical protein
LSSAGLEARVKKLEDDVLVMQLLTTVSTVFFAAFGIVRCYRRQAK